MEKQVLQDLTIATILTIIRDQTIVGGVETGTITTVDQTSPTGLPVVQDTMILALAHQRSTDLLTAARIDQILTISCQVSQS